MDHPVNLFVAGFLGLPPMSLLSGGSISGNKLVLGDTLIPLPERALPLVQDNQSVTLGMRQETVKVIADVASTKGIQLPAEVESFETDLVHRTQIVHLRTGQWRYAGLCPLDTDIRAGKLIRAQLDPQQLYLFDTKSGLRI
jgi:ABC-type sugar transport system ATPase subunit